MISAIIHFVRWPCGKYLLVRTLDPRRGSSLFVLFITLPATARRKPIRIYRSPWQTSGTFVSSLFSLQFPMFISESQLLRTVHWKHDAIINPWKTNIFDYGRFEPFNWGANLSIFLISDFHWMVKLTMLIHFQLKYLKKKEKGIMKCRYFTFDGY